MRCPGPFGLLTGVPVRCVTLCVQCPGPLGSCAPVCPLGALPHVCGGLGHLAPVHRCARSVRGVVMCAVSRATWLPFTGVPARCAVLCVRCPGQLGSCSPVCPLGALSCISEILGHLSPVHLCAPSVSSVRSPGPLASCSLVCSLGVLCCLCGVLGHLAPVHRCARLVCCVACAVSWATWLVCTGVPARCAVSRVRCPGALGSWSHVCSVRALCLVCGVLGHLAPVQMCVRSVGCPACAVSWATWLLFTDVLAPRVVLRVWCPGPLGSCSPVCSLGVLCCVCRVRGHLAPVHRCARSASCVACAVTWATWLLFTGVFARWMVWRLRCPGALGSCSPVSSLRALCCVCSVLGHLVPAQRCRSSVRCFACVVSWATWLLFTVVLSRRVVLRVRCPGPLGSCSPVCSLGGWCGVCRVVGHLAPVHRCARSVRCVACVVSWGTWLLFTGVLARHVVLPVRRPGLLGASSPLCSLGALSGVCGVRAVGSCSPVSSLRAL